MGLHCSTQPTYCTLPKKSVLCQINWGTQWTMEIRSNEKSAPMEIEKNENSVVRLERTR